MIVRLLFKAAFALAPALPPSTHRPIARATARIEYLVSAGRRRAVRQNLAHIARHATPSLPEPEIPKGSALSIFESYHRFLLEYFAQGSIDTRTLEARFRFVGMELLYQALAYGRGVVLCALHVGNWELGGIALARLGFRVHVVTGVQFHARATRFARDRKIRERILVSTPAEGFRPLLTTLSHGGIVVLLTDGDVFMRSVPARFFGEQVPFPVGPALLARRAEAPLLHGHTLRDGSGRHVVSFDGLELPDRAAPFREDLLRLTGRIAEAQERTIASHVDQWCIFRPMFPNGDAA